MRAPSKLGAFTVMIVAIVQTGCKAQVGTENDESRRATSGLRQLCMKAGAGIEPAPGVRAVVENEADQSGTHLVGIRFEVLSGGEVVPDLTFGSVGVGTSPEDARNIALDEWLALFGGPYCAARAAAQSGIRAGGFVVYPSPIGLRGEHPGEWLKDDSVWGRRILAAAATVLAPRRQGEIGVLDVKVYVQNGVHPSGECRLNGSLNVAACDRITSLPWHAGTYMYKQAFAYKAEPP